MEKITTYKAAIEYLFTQLPMFQRQGGSALKKDLTNIKSLMKLVGNPHERFKSIHVAGTNGKGTVSHLIASILQEYGWKVGLYTSPHYKDFRERIKINGKFISKEEVIDFTKKIQDVRGRLNPSFFEITVAMAFEYFASQKVDIAVIETGLGGRLDSTNIIYPELSVITNISYDHMEFLGDTLEKIAAEKAGIIKQGVPVVIGEKSEETALVFESKARLEGSSLSFAEEMDLNWEMVSSSNSKLENPFKIRNQRTALASIKVLAQRELIEWKPTYINAGIENLKRNTFYIGRWEILGENPLILADSAHNEAGVRGVLEQILPLEYDVLHIILGFVNDKEVEKILKLMPTEAKYYFVKADIPRGMPAAKLQERASLLNLKGRSYVSVKNGLKAARRNATKEDMIYIGGSIFVLAEIL